jgi:hypothetical protein
MSHQDLPPYLINFEGTDFLWQKSSITPNELRSLVGLALGEEIIEIDMQTQVQATLGEDAVIELKPGHGFAKNHHFNRGLR